MTAASPQSRFLLRGSVLLILLLALWWFVLANPLLFLLRGFMETFGSTILGGNPSELVQETAAGDWRMRVPLEAIVQDPTQPSGLLRIHSVDFDIARSDVITFTFSLPVFWAIVLAAPGIRRAAQPLVTGTLWVAVLEIVLLLIYVEIFAHNAAAQSTHSQSELSAWFLRFGEYLVILVIPYAAPFLIAISVHRELRSQMLGWAAARPASQPVEDAGVRSERKRKRGR
jgi:hypothetical protein